MHDVCGNKASSISLRGLQSAASDPTTTNTTSSKAPVKQSATDSCVPSSSTSCNGSVIGPSSDTDEDDVIAFETVSLKKDKSKPRATKKPKKNEPPQWFQSMEDRLSAKQDEWRDEMRKRMDRQESLQTERTAAIKQTNELLKQLIAQCRNDP